MIQLKRRHYVASQRQRYFAVWLGPPDACMLLMTTKSACLARRRVQTIRAFDGGQAFYSAERGPLVLLGRDYDQLWDFSAEEKAGWL